MRKEKKNTRLGLNIALGVLLATWSLLLALLIFIYALRLQGYEDFQDWQDRDKPKVSATPLPSVQPPATGTPMPTPTQGAEPSVTEAPSPMPSGTLTPTAAPTPTPTPTPTPAGLLGLVVSGDESIDADIRRQAVSFAGDAVKELAYEVYTVENYLSVVFHKAEEFEGESVEVLLPLVYDLTAKKQVTGSELIKESYFAIIKERLQTYAAENFPASEGSEFITYAEVYQEEDYRKFYLTGDSLVFWFDGNTLLPEGQKPFTYAVSLEEAKAFFHYNLDGTESGIAIRELDPKAKMVAFTFDDGPAYKYDLDIKLVELFKKYNGRATFFFLGDRIAGSFRGKVQQVYEAGFEVASHTWSHTVDFGSSREDRKAIMWQEFNQTNLVIAEVTGHAPDYVRLPGGTAGKWPKEFPVPIINWNVDSIDYRDKSKTNGATLIYNRLKEEDIQDGSIILLHSIYQNSYDATEKLLEYLDAQGFEFVTVSELFYYKGVELEDGVVYYDGFGRTTAE